MATRKVKVKPKLPLGPQFPIVVETFQALGAYEIGKLRQDPSCYNAAYLVEKLDCIFGPTIHSNPAVKAEFAKLLVEPEA